jgi:hypothetical protein
MMSSGDFTTVHLNFGIPGLIGLRGSAVILTCLVWKILQFENAIDWIIEVVEDPGTVLLGNSCGW